MSQPDSHKETPWSHTYIGYMHERQRHKPNTRLEAVMRAHPHDEPVMSIEETAELLELVREAFDSLDDVQQDIVESTLFGKETFRSVADRMHVTKSTVHRWRNEALQEMKKGLADNPLVIEYLEGKCR